MGTVTTLPILTRKDSATAQPLVEMATSAKGSRPLVKHNENSLDMTVLGMCSGAALDGVSCALFRYRQRSPNEPLRMSMLKHEETTVPLRLRTQILNLLRDHPKNPNAMVRVHSMLGYMYSTAVKCFLGNNGFSEDDVHLIAARADSIPPSVAPRLHPTLVIDEVSPVLKSWTAVIAAETNITTASNLPITRRPVNEIDPTAGFPIDSLFLQHATKFRVCVTIMDLLTITIIPPADGRPRVAPPSSVCGPGTIFIDYTMRYATSNRIQNDYHGTYSSKGIANHAVVDRVLQANDYSLRVPPLRIATEMFGHHEAQGVIEECLFLGMTDHDTVATITRITAENLVRQYRRLVAAYCPPDQKVDEIFICGTGARNTDIVDYLEEVLPAEAITRPLDDIGIPGDAKETMCCAHLGLEALLKHAVKEDGPFEQSLQNSIIGAVAKGRHWETTKAQLMRFSDGEELPAVQRVVIERK
ncbi:hypothetical protein PMIN06_007882 [Paraphaeosphaeria minitans]|uniref:Upf0075 domain protein n=1 Tax=Paraphaeosphaeria minitans TaxID=565426 RepID=A0A9P6GAS8_9PLEO|nr:upf0075 domain protein [Paraphaeosphaeria minitans]